MATHALGLNPLLDHLRSAKRSVKHVNFADNLPCREVGGNQNLVGDPNI